MPRSISFQTDNNKFIITQIGDLSSPIKIGTEIFDNRVFLGYGTVESNEHQN